MTAAPVLFGNLGLALLLLAAANSTRDRHAGAEPESDQTVRQEAPSEPAEASDYLGIQLSCTNDRRTQHAAVLVHPLVANNNGAIDVWKAIAGGLESASRNGWTCVSSEPAAAIPTLRERKDLFDIRLFVLVPGQVVASFESDPNQPKRVWMLGFRDRPGNLVLEPNGTVALKEHAQTDKVLGTRQLPTPAPISLLCPRRQTRCRFRAQHVHGALRG